ncbi:MULTISPECIES: thioesterase II family protein [Streptomyces]|uniref:Thioesterase II family protein n=1 Tax=Streptomyces nondiastaticus TaxID=3154512 RepID=A0ABW6TU24_9ACTN|nr:alpha/beta fold hydrolase [Streptomyces sp. VNUA116]WKU48215.1 alpha/beta fold hydrolase [Streptomyces sp. VNUA116]
MIAAAPGTPTSHDWITARHAAGAPRVRIICLAQAGGGAGAFSGWRAHLPEGVELAPVELPGRGTKGDIPMPGTFEELCDLLFAGLTAEFAMPYVLFGHSFGGALAYELTRRAEAHGPNAPLATVVSGARAPHVPPTGKISGSSDKELLRWLLDHGGLPAELLRFTDYLAYVMRAIRTDLAFAEGYLLPGPVRVASPLHAFAGADDRLVPPAQVERWADCAGSAFSLTVLPGGHSFPHTDPAALLAAIGSVLPGGL